MLVATKCSTWFHNCLCPFASPAPRRPQDRRKELSKKCSKMGEDGKVAVRNIRKDILKRLDR